MDSIRKLFDRSFKNRAVMNEGEFYASIHFLSKDISNSILKDMKSMGLVTVHKRKDRIYNNEKRF